METSDEYRSFISPSVQNCPAYISPQSLMRLAHLFLDKVNTLKKCIKSIMLMIHRVIIVSKLDNYDKTENIRTVL